MSRLASLEYGIVSPERRLDDEAVDERLEMLADQVDAIFTPEILSEIKHPEGKQYSPDDRSDIIYA